jgi:hypothetical protein
VDQRMKFHCLETSNPTWRQYIPLKYLKPLTTLYAVMTQPTVKKKKKKEILHCRDSDINLISLNST